MESSIVGLSGHTCVFERTVCYQQRQHDIDCSWVTGDHSSNVSEVDSSIGTEVVQCCSGGPPQCEVTALKRQTLFQLQW
jgi:hypothetical protein